MIYDKDGLVPIVVFDETDGWEALREICFPSLDQRGLCRLQKSLGNRTRTVVVEHHYIDKDYRDTFSHFHSKRFSTPPSRCIRLHFFNAVISHTDLVDAKRLQDAYLGYTVIRPTKPNCIGRTLLDLKNYSGLGAYVCVCKTTVNLQGTEIAVAGVPFISQDVDATVCAQAALWMILRYFSTRYSVYSECYPSQISNLVQDYAFGGRISPTEGLYTWQLAETLRRLRFSPVTYSRVGFSEQDFNRIIYTYIESGIPLLATLDSAIGAHVVVLNGHLVGSPIPVDIDESVFTADFATGVTINDDNGMPYERLPQHQCGHAYLKFCQIKEIIAPLAEKIFLTAENFERVVHRVLMDSETGISSISPTLAKETLVHRMYLTSVRSFKKRLASRGMGAPDVEQAYRKLPLPHFVWVCELSTPTAYASGNVLGEIIWDATRNPHEGTVGWIAIHYPENLLLDVGSALNDFPVIEAIPLTNSKPYPLYRSNLQEV